MPPVMAAPPREAEANVLNPVMAHQTQMVEGKPEYFESDKPSLSRQEAERDPARVAGHWLDTGSQGGGVSYVTNSSMRRPAVYTGQLPAQPRLDATPAEETNADWFVTTLWRHITTAQGPRPTHGRFTHVPKAFSVHWLATLELPTRERTRDGQMLNFADHGFTRHPDLAAMHANYQAEQCTWIFQRVNDTVPWVNLASGYLTEFSDSRIPVTASVYDSLASDRPTSVHWDDWYAVVVQFSGVKEWTLGRDEAKVITMPGDVLLIPKGLIHAVATPADARFSRHLVLNMCMETVYLHES